MRSTLVGATLASVAALLSCSQPVHAQPKLGHQLTRAELKKLQPGLLVVAYPRHSSQIDKYGAFVETADLGAPVQSPNNPYVINQLSDWKFPRDYNAIATGLLKIDVPGEYRFNVNTNWDRGNLAVDGQMVCPYRDGEEKVGTITLEKGYISIVSGGYFAADGHVLVKWQPPGAKEMQPIPSELLFFMPPDPKKKK